MTKRITVVGLVAALLLAGSYYLGLEPVHRAVSAVFDIEEDERKSSDDRRRAIAVDAANVQTPDVVLLPIVDGAGGLRGVLTRDDLIKALRERGPVVPVIDVMRDDIPTVDHRSRLDEPLRLMQEKQLPAVGITDVSGQLIGLLTPENVGEMMMVQTARPAASPSKTAIPLSKQAS